MKGASIDKFMDSPEAAVADVHDGATVLIGGFGGAGMPTELIHALIDQGARGLTVVSNNAGNRDTGLAALIKAGRVQGHLFLSQGLAFLGIRRVLPGRPYRAGMRAARHIANACVPRAPAWAAFHADAAPNLPRARKPASSTGADTYSRCRCGATSRWSRRTGRPLGQPDLQQERTQFRPRHVHGRAHHHCKSAPAPRELSKPS